MRRAAKIDANQGDIVQAFRALGCSVAITSAVGDGFPDLVVGINGLNVLVEVKDGSRPPSERKLTPAQVVFHEGWRGQAVVVISVEQAVALVNAVRRHLQGHTASASGSKPLAFLEAVTAGT